MEPHGFSFFTAVKITTSEYVSRMWGGRIYLEDIEVAMKEVKIFL